MVTPAPPSDQALVRYLLGGLSQQEAERLDELSVVDGEFSDRLRAIEHDLADAYVRGELSGPDREEWERRYLASERGRQDLRIAQALFARERRQSVPRRRATYTWGLAAAAALLISTVGAYFVVVHRSSPVPVSASIAPTSGQTPGRGATALRVAALTLTPMTRGLADPAVLTLPPGTDQVRVTLRLEPNDFTKYDVDLKDLSTNAIVWRTAGAAAEGVGDAQALAIVVPASILQPRRYLITVSGARPGGPDIIGTYPLQIVLQ